MVKVKEDLTGKMFGKLTVIKQAEDYICQSNNQHFSQWWCKCDCGNEELVLVRTCNLISKHTQSCGCIRRNKKRNANKYQIFEDYGILFTSNTNEIVYFDIDDSEKILQYYWHKDSSGYPSTNINKKQIRLHVFLGFKWHDHQNQNKLDNRKVNLRPCTSQENNRNIGLRKTNTSGVTGVYWFDKNKKWISQINIDKRTKYLGSFAEKDKAIEARLYAELEHYGEFAPQGYLFKQYNITSMGDNK